MSNSLAWYHRNREKALAYKREYQRQNPEKNRARGRKRAGLPAPTRPEPQLCECCGNPPSGRGSLHLDHDHATGKFRGWICSKCNAGIGLLGDTIEGALRAFDYLVRNA